MPPCRQLGTQQLSFMADATWHARQHGTSHPHTPAAHTTSSIKNKITSSTVPIRFKGSLLFSLDFTWHLRELAVIVYLISVSMFSINQY